MNVFVEPFGSILFFLVALRTEQSSLTHKVNYQISQSSSALDFKTLPEVLRGYAERVRKLPAYVEEKWKPARTAALAQLLWYVKNRTGRSYNDDVAALVSVLLNDPHLTVGAIKGFRKRHAVSIRKSGPLSVIPILPRRPR